MASRSYTVRLEAEYRAFVQAMDGAAKAADKVGDAVDKAGARAERAHKQQADAAGRVRVAEQKLAEARSQYGAQSSQVVAAEERLSKARRDQEKATKEVVTAEQQLRKASAAASQETTKQASAAGRLAAHADRNKEAWERSGRALTIFGAVTTAALGATVNAAMQWESAWTGVLKTVDGTPEQIGALEDELRGLAKTLPSSHKEIAAVAEAAGQLGVQTGAVSGFTKVMIDLGETTNLSAEEAATSIAQMANVMNPELLSSSEDVSRLGSVIVALGNAGASTERDIVTMATRISGAGKLVGASEREILALASALSSMGVTAELGGSVASRVLQDLYSAVSEGGPRLTQFADVAGMSATDFATAFQNDPVRALDSVASGLNQVEASGGNVVGTLKDLGFESSEEQRVLLQLKGAGDLLTNSLDLANSAWAENTALVNEASKRYETAEAKVQVAKNSLNDAAITIGQMFLPVLADGAEAVAKLANWFSDLPDPVQKTVAALTGAVGVTALLAGGFLLLLPRVLAFRDAWQSLPSSITAADGKLGKFMKTAGAVTAVVTAIQLIGTSLDTTSVSAEEVNNRLTGVAENGKELASIFEGLEGSWWEGSGNPAIKVPENTEEWKALIEQLDQATSGFGKFQAEAAGFLNLEGEFGNYLDTIKEVGVSLGDLADTDLSGAQKQFSQFVEAAGGGEEVTRQLLNLMPEYEEKLYSVASAQKLSLDETSLLKFATGELSGAMQASVSSAEGQKAAMLDAAAAVGLTEDEYKAAADAAEKLRASQDEASRAFIDISGTYTSLLDAQKAKQEETAQKTAESKGVEGEAWKGFVGDVKVSLAEYLTELEKQAEAQASWQSNLLSLTDSLSSQTIQYLQSLGPEGAALVQQLTEASSEELTKFDGLTQQTMAGASAGWVSTMEQGMALVQAVLAEKGPEAASALADSLASGKTTVEEAAAELGAVIEEKIPGQVTVAFGADTEPAKIELGDLLAEVASADGVITFEGDSGPASRSLAGVQAKINAADGTVDILGADGKAITTLRNYTSVVNAAEGTVDIQGEDQNGVATVVTLTNWINDQGAAVTIDADTTEAVNAAYAAAASIRQIVATIQVRATQPDLNGAAVSGSGRMGTFATGGVVGYAGGGKVPGTPPADPRRDNVPAMSETGTPYMVRSGEWIINEQQSKKNNKWLRAINNGLVLDEVMPQGVMGYATGGAVGYAEKDAAIGRREFQRDSALVAKAKRGLAIAKKTKNQGNIDYAEYLVDFYEKQLDRSQQRVQDTTRKLASLRDERSDTYTDISRGQIVSQATSGLSGAFSVVDRMKSLATSGDVSKEWGAWIKRGAADAERSMKGLYAQSAAVEKKLEAARDRLQELSQIKAGVASKLAGEGNIGDALGQKNAFGYDVPVTAQSILASTKARVAAIRTFATRLSQLQSLGYSGVILQEVVGLGSQEGTQVADALIKGGRSTAASLNSQFRSIDTLSGAAGQSVSAGFFKGGVDAAAGLVKGLESQEKTINKAIERIAVGMQNTLKTALGIKSPSRKFMEMMDYVGDGTVMGVDAQHPKVRTAMARYGQALTPVIPEAVGVMSRIEASRTAARVSALTASPGGSSPVSARSSASSAPDITAMAQAVAGALSSAQVHVTVGVDKRMSAQIVLGGIQEAARTDRRVLQEAVR